MPRLDPRLKAPLTTVNGQIADRAIRHALFLERLKTQEVDEIIGFLNRDVMPDLLDQVERRLSNIDLEGSSDMPRRNKRVRDMFVATRDLMRGGMHGASNRLKDDLRNIAITEAEWQVKVIREAVPVALDLTTPSIGVLQSIITSRPMRGQLLSNWFGRLGTNAADQVERAISVGIAEGEAVPDIVRRLRGTRANRFTDGVLNITRRHAEAVVRTSVGHVTNHANEAAYEANRDVVKAVRYIATLDARTTEICMSLDGEVFNVGEGPRPPMHHQCRSRTTPVLKSWRELGIDLKEAPEGTRASMDGQVPASTTYPQWLKNQPASVQDEALGPTRGRMFRNGEVTIDRFVDDRRRKLTLAELRSKEGLDN